MSVSVARGLSVVNPHKTPITTRKSPQASSTSSSRIHAVALFFVGLFTSAFRGVMGAGLYSSGPIVCKEPSERIERALACIKDREACSYRALALRDSAHSLHTALDRTHFHYSYDHCDDELDVCVKSFEASALRVNPNLVEARKAFHSLLDVAIRTDKLDVMHDFLLGVTTSIRNQPNIKDFRQHVRAKLLDQMWLRMIDTYLEKRDYASAERVVLENQNTDQAAFSSPDAVFKAMQKMSKAYGQIYESAEYRNVMTRLIDKLEM